ncbi:MAG: hypothetical protein ACOYJB_08830, partial [Christensenellaceae bacterium]
QICRLVDGELPKVEEQPVLDRIGASGAYREYYEELLQIKAAAKEQDREAPASFRAAWQAALEVPEEGRAHRKRNAAWKILVPAAAAVVCGAFIFSAWNTGSMPESIAEEDVVLEAAVEAAGEAEMYVMDEAVPAAGAQEHVAEDIAPAGEAYAAEVDAAGILEKAGLILKAKELGLQYEETPDGIILTGDMETLNEILEPTGAVLAGGGSVYIKTEAE